MLDDRAGNIASKQVEASVTGALMTTYSHNNLNQVTGVGGSGGVQQVVLRGQTNEPAVVKAKPGIASEWKDARMLEGNRFEADLNLLSGSNTINIQAKDGSNNVSNYTYALSLASASTATPQYDTDGNLLSDGVRSFEWDRQSRLVKITWGGSPVKSTEYRYNALGQRSERIEKTGTTTTSHHYSLYDGKDLLCRYTGGTAAANIDRQYLAQGEQRNISGTWSSHYYNRDHLGSIREVMHSDGSLAARYDYDPYGKRQTQYLAATYTGGCDLGYTGHITQQSPVDGQGEIVLTLFRAYDPELGRWLSPDPLERVTGEMAEMLPEGSNLYAYVGNNPTNMTDPSGLYIHVDPRIVGQLYNDASRIRREGHQKFPGEKNSSCRHQHGAMELALLYNSSVSRTMGGLNEIQGFLWHDLWAIPSTLRGERSSAFQLKDLVDNERGIAKAKCKRQQAHKKPKTKPLKWWAYLPIS